MLAERSRKHAARVGLVNIAAKSLDPTEILRCLLSQNCKLGRSGQKGRKVKQMFPKRPDLDHFFRRRDLEAFLERLFVGAVPIDVPDDDMVDVQKAVKRVCCSTIDVVRLVLDRKLGFVGRQTDKHGFSALLISIAEVRSLMRGSMEGWLTAETIGSTMRTNWAVVRNLINRGILPVETIVSPLNRCPVKIIPQAAFDEFRREYTTLFEAMETTGIHFRRI